MRQIGQYLVAADIEGAEDDRPALRLLEDAAVELGLVVDCRESVPHHQRNLGAKEPDPLGAGARELRQIEQQPGVQQQLDRDPSRVIGGAERSVS